MSQYDEDDNAPSGWRSALSAHARRGEMGDLQFYSEKGVLVKTLTVCLDLAEFWGRAAWLPSKGAVATRFSYTVIPAEDLEMSSFLDHNVIQTAVSLVNAGRVEMLLTDVVLKASKVDDDSWNVTALMTFDLGPLRTHLRGYERAFTKMPVGILQGVSTEDCDRVPVFPPGQAVHLEFSPSSVPILWRDWGVTAGQPSSAERARPKSFYSRLTGHP